MGIALMMEAASTSETTVNFYQTTRRNNPEEVGTAFKQKRSAAFCRNNS
jgi:hypothetical protein